MHNALKNKRINTRVKGLMPLFFLAAFAGCNKEGTDIGLNLRPDGGFINSIAEEFTQITCRTVAGDSLRTDSLSANILGAISDPAFGTSRASLIIQPMLNEYGFDLSGKSIDSAVLTLKFDRSQNLGGFERILTYGDLNSEMEIDIYKLGEKIVAADNYYSNFKPSLGDKIGTFKGKFNFYDSAWIKINGDSTLVSPQLTIKLNSSFGQEVLDQNASVFSSNDNFLEYLKGIVLVPKTNLASGKGAIVGIDTKNASTRLTLYYNDSLLTQIPVSQSSERINLYDQFNVNGNIVGQQTSSGHYNTTYVQAMGGARVKVNINDLKTIIERGEKVAINEAIITFSLNESKSTSNFAAPIRLLLSAISKEDGRAIAYLDYIDAVDANLPWRGYTNYGGLYNGDTYQYSFHFNRYLQQLVDEYNATGENNFEGFYLSVPSDSPIIPARGVLKSDPSLGEVKVSVRYTKLN